MDMPSFPPSNQLSAFFQEASKRKLSLQPQSRKTFGRWTKEEHQKFIDGLKLFGKNWKKVEEHVGTRNGAQIRSHAQKFFNRLDKELRKKDALMQGDSISEEGSENMEGIEEYMEEMKKKEARLVEQEERSRSQSTNFSMNNGFVMNAGLTEENSLVNKVEKKVEKKESQKFIPEQKKTSIEYKKELLLKELSLLFSEETIKRIQTIISLLNETENSLENEEREDNKISFFNSLFNFKEEIAPNHKIPKLSDLVDMNQTKESPSNLQQVPNSTALPEFCEKKPRKDSFKFCNDENLGGNLGLFSLKRKGSLDESMLQKKVKKEGN